MKKYLLTVPIALLIAIGSIIYMQGHPFDAPQQEVKCCDQFNLESSYGYPLHFKNVYSGGLSGKGSTFSSTKNLILDGTIIFVSMMLLQLAALKLAAISPRLFSSKA